MLSPHMRGPQPVVSVMSLGSSDLFPRDAFRSTRARMQGVPAQRHSLPYGQAGQHRRRALVGETPKGPGLCAPRAALLLAHWQ